MLLKQCDFCFEPCKNNGDSGQLLLATRKIDGKKFVVKHEYSDCACNEFIYFAVAKELALKTLECHLFEKDDKRINFKSGYAIAIEYIDSKELKNISNEKKSIKNWQDYFSHLALYAAFLECDSFEILVCNNYLYRIDTTDAFVFSNFFVSEIENPLVQMYLSDLASQKEEQIYSSITFMSNRTKSKYSNEEYNIFCKTFKDLSFLNLKKIEPYLNELCEIYPKEFGNCYKNFLVACQKACLKFT